MHLEQRRRRWYALHEIPADLRKTLGRYRFVASLGTEDRKVAERRAPAFETQWRLAIDQARNTTLDPLEADAQFWRDALARSTTVADKEAVLDQLRGQLQDRVERAGDKLGIVDHRDPRYAELPEHDTGGRLYALASGKLTRFDEHLDEWLATLKDTNGAKGNDAKLAAVRMFAKEFPYVQDVRRKAVQHWLNKMVTEGGKTATTARKTMSDLRIYWNYLVSIEAVSEEHLPLERLTTPKTAKTGETVTARRREFTAKEVLGLLKAAEDRKDQQLADLIRLGMYTGARMESLCSLRVENVNMSAWSFDLADKTDAGRRTVPVHSKLKDTVKRLCEESKGGFLIQGLNANKYGDRSNALSARFSRMKTALGYGPDQVFHSIRRTVATLLQNAGVVETTAADILGHEIRTETYGVYSGGASLEVKRKAIEKLRYLP